MLAERWLVSANFEKGPKRFFDQVPAPIRPVIAAMVRRKMKRSLHLHGFGRHDAAQKLWLVQGDIDTLATTLGDKPFLFGDRSHGADATVFASMASILMTDLQPSIRAVAETHAALGAYVDRMSARYHPNFSRGGGA